MAIHESSGEKKEFMVTKGQEDVEWLMESVRTVTEARLNSIPQEWWFDYMVNVSVNLSANLFAGLIHNGGGSREDIMDHLYRALDHVLEQKRKGL